MRSPVMVVIEISGNDTPEMAFVQNDEMIEAIVAQGSDQPLHEPVLPWTARCTKALFDPHALAPPLKCAAVDRIAITKEVLRRAVPGEGFDDLLARPLSRRILGNVEVQNFPSRMCKHNQHEEELESDCRYDEEIDRH